jgi:methionine biosynthesis protein MetW
MTDATHRIPLDPRLAALAAIAAGGTPRVAIHGSDVNGLRPDLALIADWIEPGSRVLDLGCGDGALLDHLQRSKGCQGYGVEIDDAQVLACARRGVDVIQQNFEAGLGIFEHTRFDVVILSMAIQATFQTERVLREMSRVGREGIVSFPNFGHWYHAWSILKGRMPVSQEMPYQWYDTPNLHLATPRDFEDFLQMLGLEPTRSTFLAHGRRVRWLPAQRSTQAIYRFRKAVR